MSRSASATPAAAQGEMATTRSVIPVRGSAAAIGSRTGMISSLVTRQWGPARRAISANGTFATGTRRLMISSAQSGTGSVTTSSQPWP